jgi:predicted porin
MKKSLIALAALAATASFAQTTTGQPGFQIQGLINAGAGHLSYKGVGINGFEQNGAGTTQINFRGLEDLGGGMQAYFRMENDISIVRNDANQGVITDVGNAVPQTSSTANYTAARTQKGATSTFGNGELIVGTRGSFGDVAFGAINNAGLLNFVLLASPVQGTSYAGGYGSIIGADPTLGSVRWNNSFRYVTPTFAGFNAQYIYSAKQNVQKNTFNASGVAATTVNTGLGANDQIGAGEFSLRYANGPLTVGYVNTQTNSTDASFCSALSVSSNTAFLANTANQPCVNNSVAGTAGANGAAVLNGFKSTQNSVAAKYELGGGFTLSGGYQATVWKEIVAGAGDQANRKAYIGSLTYVTGPHTVFGTYGASKESAANNSFNGGTSKMVGLGYNYALSKNTYIYARHEQLDDQAGTIASSWAGAAPTVSLLGMDASQKRVRQQVGLAMNF